MGKIEILCALILIAVASLGAIAYLIRLRLFGKVRFERVDRQGGSALLSKAVMEGAYWFLQPLGRLLVSFRVTPNQVTWCAVILGAIAGCCLAFGHFGSAAIFAAISALLDALDGMVARMAGVASEAGEILDASADRYTEFFFLGGLVVYYREVLPIMILALLALAGSFMVSYSTAKAEGLQIQTSRGNMRRPERALYLILGAALSPVTIPWLETTREFPVPIAHPMIIALGLVAVLANISAIERLTQIARAVRGRASARRAAEAERERQTVTVLKKGA